ncbi:aminotransferase class IV [uncultured Rhodoblastus sp.]|uniref:aminotransferase class IV n=1 Tax=uncultured Rhodoblastus sp. TaxID=543037 RepID=UPI0025E4F08F|nr:aminotransferase class IV [uncultured Rhodoblastus sp.]
MSSQGALPDRLEDFGLIETLLWTREGGYFLRAGHEARLENSARALGFAFDQTAFDEALARACADGAAPRLRVRLALRRDGAIEAAAAPCAPEPPGKIWRVAIARQRFDSRDALLRHKTTRREIYESALAEAQAADQTIDEVIFLNERYEICEGARTNIFILTGDALWTPPLSCGLLPGVLRADLLARGKAREKILGKDDLREEFLLGNSLRGLLRARLGD